MGLRQLAASGAWRGRGVRRRSRRKDGVAYKEDSGDLAWTASVGPTPEKVALSYSSPQLTAVNGVEQVLLATGRRPVRLRAGLREGTLHFACLAGLENGPDHPARHWFGEGRLLSWGPAWAMARGEFTSATAAMSGPPNNVGDSTRSSRTSMISVSSNGYLLWVRT